MTARPSRGLGGRGGGQGLLDAFQRGERERPAGPQSRDELAVVDGPQTEGALGDAVSLTMALDAPDQFEDLGHPFSIGMHPRLSRDTSQMRNSTTLGNLPTMSTKWKSRFQEVLHSHFGGNQRRMSLAAGMNDTWVRDVLKAKGPPKIDSLVGLAEATGLPVTWFVNGEGDEAFSAARPYKGQLPGAVPQIDAEAGAGDGRVGDVVAIHSGGVSSGHRVVSEWVIPREELGVEPSRVVILPVIGTSMAPSLLPGDKVIVDTQATSIKHGEIYVLDEGDGPVVKRARLLRDEEPILLEIISENPSVAPVRRPAEMVRVIGRVIGRWTRM